MKITKKLLISSLVISSMLSGVLYLEFQSNDQSYQGARSALDETHKNFERASLYKSLSADLVQKLARMKSGENISSKEIAEFRQEFYKLGSSENYQAILSHDHFSRMNSVISQLGIISIKKNALALGVQIEKTGNPLFYDWFALSVSQYQSSVWDTIQMNKSVEERFPYGDFIGRFKESEVMPPEGVSLGEVNKIQLIVDDQIELMNRAETIEEKSKHYNAFMEQSNQYADTMLAFFSLTHAYYYQLGTEQKELIDSMGLHLESIRKLIDAYVLDTSQNRLILIEQLKVEDRKFEMSLIALIGAGIFVLILFIYVLSRYDTQFSNRISNVSESFEQLSLIVRKMPVVVQKTISLVKDKDVIFKQLHKKVKSSSCALAQNEKGLKELKDFIFKTKELTNVDMSLLGLAEQGQSALEWEKVSEQLKETALNLSYASRKIINLASLRSDSTGEATEAIAKLKGTCDKIFEITKSSDDIIDNENRRTRNEGNQSKVLKENFAQVVSLTNDISWTIDNLNSNHKQINEDIDSVDALIDKNDLNTQDYAVNLKDNIKMVKALDQQVNVLNEFVLDLGDMAGQNLTSSYEGQFEGHDRRGRVVEKDQMKSYFSRMVTPKQLKSSKEK